MTMTTLALLPGALLSLALALDLTLALPSAAQHDFSLPTGAQCSAGEQCASGVCLNSRCDTQEALVHALAPWAVGVLVSAVLVCVCCVLLCACALRSRSRPGVVLSRPQEQEQQWRPHHEQQFQQEQYAHVVPAYTTAPQPALAPRGPPPAYEK